MGKNLQKNHSRVNIMTAERRLMKVEREKEYYTKKKREYERSTKKK